MSNPFDLDWTKPVQDAKPCTVAERRLIDAHVRRLYRDPDSADAAERDPERYLNKLELAVLVERVDRDLYNRAVKLRVDWLRAKAAWDEVSLQFQHMGFTGRDRYSNMYTHFDEEAQKIIDAETK